MEDPEEHFANWREEDEENRDVLEDREVMDELFGEEAEEAPAPRTTQMIDLPVVEDATKVKKPKRELLKLDLNKLFSERGLEAVEGHISAVKIRGKGHELEDLTNICKAYEHWAHRLYPKMRFDDVLEKVEKLGVINQRKCRMHKAVLYQKHRRLNDIMDKNSDNEDEDAQWPEPVENKTTDQMFGDSSFGQNASFRQSQDISSSFGQDPFNDPPPPIPPPPSTLTEEQKERMRLNRIRALEKKRSSMAPQAAKDTPVTDTTNALPETNSEMIEVAEQSTAKLSKESDEVESDIVVESKRLKLSEEESEVLMDVDELVGEIDPDITNEINDLIG